MFQNHLLQLMMITAMENAALNAIRGYLDPGESAVGTAVEIRHLAATPAGGTELVLTHRGVPKHLIPDTEQYWRDVYWAKIRAITP